MVVSKVQRERVWLTAYCPFFFIKTKISERNKQKSINPDSGFPSFLSVTSSSLKSD
jgi:hypothetical protein